MKIKLRDYQQKCLDMIKDDMKSFIVVADRLYKKAVLKTASLMYPDFSVEKVHELYLKEKASIGIDSASKPPSKGSYIQKFGRAYRNPHCRFAEYNSCVRHNSSEINSISDLLAIANNGISVKDLVYKIKPKEKKMNTEITTEQLLEKIKEELNIANNQSNKKCLYSVKPFLKDIEKAIDEFVKPVQYIAYNKRNGLYVSNASGLGFAKYTSRKSEAKLYAGEVVQTDNYEYINYDKAAILSTHYLQVKIQDQRFLLVDIKNVLSILIQGKRGWLSAKEMMSKLIDNINQTLNKK